MLELKKAALFEVANDHRTQQQSQSVWCGVGDFVLSYGANHMSDGLLRTSMLQCHSPNVLRPPSIQYKLLI